MQMPEFTNKDFLPKPCSHATHDLLKLCSHATCRLRIRHLRNATHLHHSVTTHKMYV